MSTVLRFTSVVIALACCPVAALMARQLPATKIDSTVKSIITGDSALVFTGEEIDTTWTVEENEPLFYDNRLSDSVKGISPMAKNLNLEGKADAYPFISADGLRLYYTSNREGGHGRIYISTRKTLNEDFPKPVLLSKNIEEGFYCATFTADELTMYLAKQGSIYFTTRPSRQHEFGTPIPVEGLSEDNNFYFAPAISPDGKELIVCMSESDKKNDFDESIVFRKSATGNFVKTGKLPSPEGWEAGPGQFSKDGLRFYLGFENSAKTIERISYFSRSNTNKEFVQLQELPAELNPLAQNMQPSINADGSIMVMVTSHGGWEEDDIVILAKTPPANELSKLDASPQRYPNAVNCYPNPFTASFTIVIPHATEPRLLQVYDISGKMVLQQRITGTISQVTTSGIGKGIYLYRLIDATGQLESSGKIAKQ